MTLRLQAALSILILVAQPLHAEYELVRKPAKEDPMAVHQYELANGLTVFLTQNHEEPRFHAEIVVRAGSKHDPEISTGIAHYLEHMMFKGSDEIGTVDYASEKIHLDSVAALYERHWQTTDPAERAAIYELIQQQSQLAATYAAPGEFDKIYSSMGAKSMNAGTGREYTSYQIDLPANRLEQWARMESERFTHPVFRLFQTELETIYEEKNRDLDDRNTLIRQAVDDLVWKVHPYGQYTILGTVEHLKNPSLRLMYEFFQMWYVPNNMAIVISGDIELEPTMQIIDSYFSALEPRQLPKLPKWKEKDLDGVERVEVSYPGEEVALLAFRTEPSTHKDTEALQVLDMILDNATAGLINLNLNQQQRVRRAGSFTTSHYHHNDGGAQYLWGIPKDGQSLEEVEALLNEQVVILQSGDFEDWLIPAIVTDFTKTYKRRMEQNSSRVGLIREAWVSFQKWDDARRTLERMAKVKKGDVVKLAKRFLGGDYVSGYRRDAEFDLPSIDKPGLEAIELDRSRQSPYMADVLAMPVSTIEPEYIIPGRDYTVRDVRPGVELYHNANPLNDLFALRVVVDFGRRDDIRLPMARRLMDKSGTAGRSAEALKQAWYRLGSDISMNVADHETVITLRGLDGSFGASVALLLEALTQPAAAAGTMEELVAITVANRQDAMKDHRAIQRALYRYHRHGEHSEFVEVPTDADLQALTDAELHELITGLLSYSHRLEYTGSLTARQVLAELSTHYQLPLTDLREPPAFEPIPIRSPAQTEILVFDKEMAQALVRIESGDVPYTEALRPAIDLYDEYFYGGFSGIVFQELREARGLAYRAWARYFPGDRVGEPNLMAGFIGCQPDKTVEALAAFLDLFDNLPESQERFVEAQASLINSRRTSRLGFRQLLGAVRMWERQGVTIDPRSWRFEQIRLADLGRVMEFHGEHIAGRPKLVTIVGDMSRIDREQLAQHGVVREVGVEEIFGY